jgi:hypothetical protein
MKGDMGDMGQKGDRGNLGDPGRNVCYNMTFWINYTFTYYFY